MLMSDRAASSSSLPLRLQIGAGCALWGPGADTELGLETGTIDADRDTGEESEGEYLEG